MSYKTEFTETNYNVPTFLNEKSGWFDESWHNDTCPRFENTKHHLQIWVECTEPSKRQVETDNIFTVQPQDDTENTILFQTDSPEQLLAYLLAVEYSAILSSWLTPELMKTVIEKNQTEEYVNLCATHEYCDSSEAMLQAFIVVTGEEYNRTQLLLFNAAWSIARTNSFFVTFKSTAA